MKKRTRKTRKQVRAKYLKTGLKMAHQDRKKPTISREEKFWEETDNITADDALVSHPNDWDVQDEISRLDSFQDYVKENRLGLTFGDY